MALSTLFFGNIVLARLWKLCWRGVHLEAERLPRRLLLLLFRQERSVSARMMAAVTAEKEQSQSHLGLGTERSW